MKKTGKMVSEVLKSFMKKPATELYPFVKNPKPAGFRGRIIFHYEKCIGCKLCMRDCPSKAITITKVADKKFEARINLDDCIFCAQCVDNCAKNALESTSDYELAGLSRDSLKTVFNNESVDNVALRPEE